MFIIQILKPTFIFCIKYNCIFPCVSIGVNIVFRTQDPAAHAISVLSLRRPIKLGKWIPLSEATFWKTHVMHKMCMLVIMSIHSCCFYPGRNQVPLDGDRWLLLCLTPCYVTGKVKEVGYWFMLRSALLNVCLTLLQCLMNVTLCHGCWCWGKCVQYLYWY